MLHVDADCFFVQVARKRDPRLRGRPVAVAGSGRRAVVASASYEARPYGVRAAQPVFQARRTCPDLTVVAVDPVDVAADSAALARTLARRFDVIEPVGSDEWYVDASGEVRTARQAWQLAETLRSEMASQHGITVTVGAGTSKLAAKLASEHAKPDGAYVHRDVDGEREFIAALPAAALPGVGPVTERKLAGLGVQTCAHLAAVDPETLRQTLGPAAARQLRAFAHGDDDREVEDATEAKSRGVGQTLDRDVDVDGAVGLVDALTVRLTQRLASDGVTADHLTVVVRDHRGREYRTARPLHTPTADPVVLREAATGAVRDQAPSHSRFRSASVSARLAGPALEPPAAPHPPRWWVDGTRVAHPQLGDGWVRGSDDDWVTVRFDRIGELQVDASTLRAAPSGPGGDVDRPVPGAAQ